MANGACLDCQGFGFRLEDGKYPPCEYCEGTGNIGVVVRKLRERVERLERDRPPVKCRACNGDGWNWVYSDHDNQRRTCAVCEGQGVR